MKVGRGGLAKELESLGIELLSDILGSTHRNFNPSRRTSMNLYQSAPNTAPARLL